MDRGGALATAAGVACGLAAGYLLGRAGLAREDGRGGAREKVPGLIVIVGMRGAGKTTLGRKAAESLKRHFLDLDEVLEGQVLNCPISDFVGKNGWPAFRKAEAQLLEDIVRRRAYGADAAQGCIVACGGGVVETPSSQALLASVTPVVFVDRHIDDILATLEGSGSYRPGLGVPPQEVYVRRLPIYQRCCSHIFTLRKGDEDWAAIEAEFSGFLCHAEGSPAREVVFRPDTFIAPVPASVFEDPSETAALLRRLAHGADALELCADGLDRRSLLERLATLRRHSYAPVCFAARGERFTGSAAESLELARLAIQAGCPMVEVEAGGCDIAELAASKGATKLVAGLGDRRKALSPKVAGRQVRQLCKGGSFDLVRATLKVSSEAQALKALAMLSKFQQDHPGTPISLSFTGEHGRLGALLNKVLTPVPCPTLSSSNGELSMPEIVDCRAKLSMLESRRYFYIFGHPVAMSASPTLQNTGFRVNGAPHVFLRYDCPELADMLWKLSLPCTGGGAVTIPHKEGLLEHMDELSEAAREIGAVNTVVKAPGSNRLSGHNTDWLGIKGQLAPKLPQKDANGRVGLILGAGGTARAAAYAFKQMGFAEVLIQNRTVEKAEGLAKAFGASFRAVKDDKELEGLKRLDAVMGTLPGTAGATLPQALVTRCKPAVIDAAYQSSASGKRFTALLQQAADAGCEVIEGMEMLFEQGCAQCELWTGKPAPRREIAAALLADRFAGSADPPKSLVKEANA